MQNQLHYFILLLLFLDHCQGPNGFCTLCHETVGKTTHTVLYLFPWLFNLNICISKMTWSTFFSRLHSIQTPSKEIFNGQQVPLGSGRK